MGRVVFRVVLAGLAFYLYLEGSTLWAVVCGFVLVWSFVQQQLSAIGSLLRRLATVPEEHAANCILTYTFSVERVIAHPAVDDVFSRLQRNGKAPTSTIEEWRTLLLASYARKHGRAGAECEIRFNIKGNLIFGNGDVLW